MSSINTAKHIFISRLHTLNHLVDIGAQHFGNDLAGLLTRRFAEDMFLLTCNQARNFALWCLGENDNHQRPELSSLEAGRAYIADTQGLVERVHSPDSQLAQIKRIELGQGTYLELTGQAYLDEFLFPNFYFHLTTVYAILRMAGAPVGKRDYMMHLMPLLQKGE